MPGTHNKSPIEDAIAQHCTADQAFTENCWRSDTLDPRYKSDTPASHERIYWGTLEAEAIALDALLSTPVLTRADSTAKGKHLLTYLQRDGLETKHFEPLLRAMVFEG